MSEPTARRFRDEHAEDIRNAQLRSTDGVLATLKDLLPDAIARLQYYLNPPTILPPRACDCAELRASMLAISKADAKPLPPHLPTCASLQSTDPFQRHSYDIRTVKTIIDAYEVMRDVDFERRLKALEKAQQEAEKAAAEAAAGRGKG